MKEQEWWKSMDACVGLEGIQAMLCERMLSMVRQKIRDTGTKREDTENEQRRHRETERNVVFT